MPTGQPLPCSGGRCRVSVAHVPSPLGLQRLPRIGPHNSNAPPLNPLQGTTPPSTLTTSTTAPPSMVTMCSPTEGYTGAGVRPSW